MSTGWRAVAGATVSAVPAGALINSGQIGRGVAWFVVTYAAVLGWLLWRCTWTAIYRAHAIEQRPAHRRMYGKASRRTADAWRCSECRSWHPIPTRTTS